MKHEGGFALVAATVLISLAGLAAMSIALLASQALKAQAITRHSLHARHDAEAKVITGLFSAAPSSGELACRTEEARRGGSSASWEACRLGDISEFPAESPVVDGMHAETFPKYDYNRIFKDTVACDGVPYDCSYHPGSRLSPSSVCTGKVCPEIPLPKTDILAVDTDLFFRLPFTPPSGGDPGFPFVLASAGFIETAAPLIVNRDLLVIAGGDLLVSAIDCQGAHRVTLVSATGRVEVSSVTGTPLLKAIGRLGVSIPPGDYGIQTLLPPPFGWELVSLGRAAG